MSKKGTLTLCNISLALPDSVIPQPATIAGLSFTKVLTLILADGKQIGWIYAEKKIIIYCVYEVK